VLIAHIYGIPVEEFLEASGPGAVVFVTGVGAWIRARRRRHPSR